MSYPAISLATATVGRYRCPQKRLQTARQPPVYPNSSPRIIAPVTPSPPSAALTPSIPVHRWIRAKAAIGITALWMLSSFSTNNGGTWIVPKTHLDTKNPRGKNDGIDERAPILNEVQATGSAGSVLVFDSRIWHSNAANPSDKSRTAVVVRYAPWWLNLEFYGVNQATLPAEVFDTFPEDVKVLYEHRVEGHESTIWA